MLEGIKTVFAVLGFLFLCGLAGVIICQALD
jgi:hypothetical protein